MDTQNYKKSYNFRYKFLFKLAQQCSASQASEWQQQLKKAHKSIKNIDIYSDKERVNWYLIINAD